MSFRDHTNRPRHRESEEYGRSKGRCNCCYEREIDDLRRMRRENEREIRELNKEVQYYRNMSQDLDRHSRLKKQEIIELKEALHKFTRMDAEKSSASHEVEQKENPVVNNTTPSQESPPSYENAQKESKTKEEKKPEITDFHLPSDAEKIQKLTMEKRQLEVQLDGTKFAIAFDNRTHQKQQEDYEKKLKEQRNEIRKLSEMHEEDKRRVYYAEKNYDVISKNFNKTKADLAKSYDENRKLSDKLKEYERYAYAQSDCDYCNNLEVNLADKVFWTEQQWADLDKDTVEDGRINEIAQIQETQRNEIEDLKKKHQEDIGDILKRLESVEKWQKGKDEEDSGSIDGISIIN
ncbi:hypothetical protein B9Z55_015613 [Caenorhabditis nigoni]|uniref:Uncharacterized protein n=1 Tax=Caenorhabditis nigoni TaxID=1611254 RepID=A0A2G5UB01_9PELO|nr:hypothetical protein B9Z55_015613 [Caenorhabditis nigoni]